MIDISQQVEKRITTYIEQYTTIVCLICIGNKYFLIKNKKLF